MAVPDASAAKGRAQLIENAAADDDCRYRLHDDPAAR
jgi:hypothetical protein